MISKIQVKYSDVIFIEQGLSREIKNPILFEIELEESIIHPGYFKFTK